MNRIEQQAKIIDQQYQAIGLLFEQFCQQAATLAGQYHFFTWPDFEESPPYCRAFTLLGEPRELRLRCQCGAQGELIGRIQIGAEDGPPLIFLQFSADGQLLHQAGHLLDNPAERLLRLLWDAMRPQP